MEEQNVFEFTAVETGDTGNVGVREFEQPR